VNDALPPVLDPAPAPPSRRAAAVALFVLALYVVVPALLGAFRGGGDGALIPGSVRDVLLVCSFELALFGAAFALAVWLGRLRKDDLLLRWGGRWVVPRAAAWSLALRFGVGIVLAVALGIWHLTTGAPVDNLGGLRPKVEAMVDVEALRDPVYMVLMLTLVSFVLAGLREELWRVGMIALLGRVLPRCFGGRLGPWLAIVPAAILFGLAHTPQGWMGVAATTGLGLGLGAIMLLHRSLWDAVLAHGFFNAATFAVLPWIAQHLGGLTG
jgi:membrane protease YdiL (CAAX protease family)